MILAPLWGEPCVCSLAARGEGSMDALRLLVPEQGFDVSALVHPSHLLLYIYRLSNSLE